jgi:ubiquinone/menaquinone biosynthesis C-methylase UbiE
VDLVLLFFMLFHLSRPLDALREARRVLRPQGRAGSVTWAKELESTALRLWRECLDHHSASPAHPETQTRHEPVNTAAKIEALFRAVGFSSMRAWVEHDGGEQAASGQRATARA